jgi:hypothetical protein
MGVLDAQMCTRSWFQAFQLHLLIQGTWIIMDWCMDGRPGRPCVHQVLVPSIPTLPVMQGIIMDWCTHGRPGFPCVHQVLVPSIPTLPVMQGIIMDWCTHGRPGRPCVHQVLVPSIPTPLTDTGDLDYNGLVHGWASRTPMCTPGLGSEHSNSTY